MERSIAMYKPFCVCICLLTGLACAVAQPATQGNKSPDRPRAAQDEQARRLALRQALQAQHSAGNTESSGARARRELSLRERSELRQQLRQQRNEFARQ
ncbi:MAG: hypothetical protein IPH37_09150 [Burkholderiales bacterium]|nr:hypothetical protein [Burkholderiales bacterium]MBK9345773.1 hypothetical protein [Burkholderiales bacterium]